MNCLILVAILLCCGNNCAGNCGNNGSCGCGLPFGGLCGEGTVKTEEAAAAEKKTVAAEIMVAEEKGLSGKTAAAIPTSVRSPVLSRDLFCLTRALTAAVTNPRIRAATATGSN